MSHVISHVSPVIDRLQCVTWNVPCVMHAMLDGTCMCCTHRRGGLRFVTMVARRLQMLSSLVCCSTNCNVVDDVVGPAFAWPDVHAVVVLRTLGPGFCSNLHFNTSTFARSKYYLILGSVLLGTICSGFDFANAEYHLGDKLHRIRQGL